MSKKMVTWMIAALLTALAPSVVAQEGSEAPTQEPEPTPIALPAPQTFELLLIAPVPVGHRVEIRWFREAVTGVITGTRFESHPDKPIILDLDSGVIYGPVELFWERGSIYALPRDSTLALLPEPRPACQLERQLYGTVVSSRVLTYDHHTSFTVQTTLVVQPEP